MAAKKYSVTMLFILFVGTLLLSPDASGFPVSISISPNTINLQSQGQWINCSVELPEPYVFENIDVETINLEGVSPEPFSSRPDSNSFSCKFSRSAVIDKLAPLAPGLLELTLSGYLTDGTTYFEGTDTVIVISKETIQYTITPSSGPNGSINPSEPVTVNSGESLVFTAGPDTGYEVDKWSLDDVVVQTGGLSYTLDNIQADHTVKVTFKQLQYSITPSAGPNGSISPSSSITVNFGSSQAFTASPAAGYEVDKWLMDDVAVQTGGLSYTLNNIKADHAINVTFKKVQYTITVSADQYGSISPSGTITVNSGEDLELTASPDMGFLVNIWSVDGTDVEYGADKYTLTDIHSDHTVIVTFRRMLSYSLCDIEFNDEQQYNSQIITNNHRDYIHPENSRIQTIREVGQNPDPNGVMLMINLVDQDPESPTYGQVVHAHVKGIFLKTDSEEILIRFKYLFQTSEPGTKLIVYLSNSSTLWELDDPHFAAHSIVVAELYAPPWPRPGSARSGRLATFEKLVGTGNLDLTEGLYIGLILVEPEPTQSLLLANNAPGILSASEEDTSIMIDSWRPAVQCYGICLDINWDNFINEADFLTVISRLGIAATDSEACLEGVFGRDGTLDSLDVASWDWAMNSTDRLLNFCGVPLENENKTLSSSFEIFYKALLEQQYIEDLPGNLSDLLILGKRGESDAKSKLKDRYYLFNSEGTFTGYSTPNPERCNMRLIKNSEGQLYLINSEKGIIQLGETQKTIVPPGKVTITDFNDPRCDKLADVYIGVQNELFNSFGRPILDAAFDTNDANYVNVLPVVVTPLGEESYTAAAQLQLLAEGNPPYKVTRIYDDPPLEYDNQYRDNLREIEIDDSGNLYVLNVHSINESDILWKYDPNGTVERLDLGIPDSNNFLQAPDAMYVSDTNKMLYLASSIRNDNEDSNSIIYGFHIDKPLKKIELERLKTVFGMQQITCITENPSTGSLWIAGFNMYDIPLYPNPYQPAFYYPMIAEIPADSNEVESISVYDPGKNDLALPMSIIWTGTDKENNLFQ